MPYSTRELVIKVLSDLKATPVGEAPADEDYAFVKDRLWPLLGELKAARVLDVFVSPIDEDSPDIPDHVFNGLAIALADQAASLVGGVPSPDPNGAGVWRRLRTAVTAAPSYLVQETENL